MSLSAEFDKLLRLVQELIGLLEEADETFWRRYLVRGIKNIEAHKLAGATFILGCYSGEGSFSDLELASELEESEPLRHRNLNARLSTLRTDVFKSASRIASRELW